MEGCLTEIFGGYEASDGIARAAYLLAKAEQYTDGKEGRFQTG